MSLCVYVYIYIYIYTYFLKDTQSVQENKGLILSVWRCSLVNTVHTNFSLLIYGYFKYVSYKWGNKDKGEMNFYQIEDY